ncbi:MAG TPA: SLC13 family permease [Bacteroidales bacterium]|nr:SLC13 family permease [Bacteroidales bacterium]HPR58578.1 SLC13 family permease [Bacteroidales bacterium]
MLSYDSIIVLAVIVFIIISLYTNLIGPAFTFIVGILLLGITGVLTPNEILSGFANEQIMVIILLLLIGQMIRNTGVLEGTLNRIFRKTNTYPKFLTRIYFSVSIMSSMLNNTPLVAVMMPYVNSWCKKNKVNPSKLLIPLSYAAIIGGSTTLIGTSTNLIVNGLIQSQTVIPDFEPFQLFDFAYVGVPMMFIGFLYLYLFADKLLPDRHDVYKDFEQNTRSYLVQTRIRATSSLAGMTIREASLRNLKGLFLAEIIRGGNQIRPVSPHENLRHDDILVFAGETTMITDLVNSNTGLELAEIGMYSRKSHTEAIEIVISYNSSLIGQTVKESMFRSKYDAAIIAIHRNGERISGKLGDVKIKAGDVLLIITGSDFNHLSQNTQDFYLISRIKDFRKPKFWEPYLVIGGLILSILLAGFKLVPLFTSLAILVTIALLLKLMNPKDLAKTVDFNLAVILAMSLALGLAMIKSGVAEHVGNAFINLLLPLGSLALLFGIFIVAALMSAFITNAAVVAMLFPIVLSISAKLGVNPFPLVMVMTFGAATSFMTPVGYQTNLMVYGPGGYTFSDFLRIGLPLTIIYMVVAVLIMYFMFFFEFSGLPSIYPYFNY